MCTQTAPRYRITQTLLSAWQYASKEGTDYDDFLRVLRREKTPPTQAMLDGIHFEGMVNAALDGNLPEETNKLYEQVTCCAEYLAGAQKQVVIFKDIVVEGINIVLHGVLDFLRAGMIYDTKYSKTYTVGKYLESPQHPMYLALVPEAKAFEYVVCDGKYLYLERYDREDVEPIETTIKQFIRYLRKYGLWDLFCEKWRIN